MPADRPVILTFLASYLPGYKAGGALRTVANMVDALSGDFHFRIVTTDRDSGDTQPYPAVAPGVWTQVGPADVLYLPRPDLTVRRCREILVQTPHDAVYLQSCFSPFTIKPLVALKMSVRQQRSVIIAPRGELYKGALSIKPLKKLVYLTFARVCGLYSGAVWQASNPDEAVAIRKWFGPDTQPVVAPDLARQHGDQCPVRPLKKPHSLRAVFLSRICPKKNLRAALNLLKSVDGSVTFDVIGPAEDVPYWADCQSLMATLPSNVTVTWRGPVRHELIPQTLAEYDLLLFPTLGENFGHVILESLLAGCPVLISDQTPWRNLQKAGVGWDLPLEDLRQFEAALQTCTDMGEREHAEYRKRAREFGIRHAADPATLERNRRLLMSVAAKGELAISVP